ncbi:hypothetical protein CCUS01_01821 [Colletotrichum cuscutae]|uniref:Uncharacterized protein n=1 Tax=Colletotrichum cuscutae TaxID=1209917 RepID=A0AAI9UIW8_9PEZI|nr:hypothetical protein CCUS01_01821 [Colletotrichum cuscutae]
MRSILGHLGDLGEVFHPNLQKSFLMEPKVDAEDGKSCRRSRDGQSTFSPPTPDPDLINLIPNAPCSFFDVGDAPPISGDQAITHAEGATFLNPDVKSGHQGRPRRRCWCPITATMRCAAPTREPWKLAYRIQLKILINSAFKLPSVPTMHDIHRISIPHHVGLQLDKDTIAKTTAQMYLLALIDQLPHLAGFGRLVVLFNAPTATDGRLPKIRSSLSLWHAGFSKSTSGWDKKPAFQTLAQLPTSHYLSPCQTSPYCSSTICQYLEVLLMLCYNLLAVLQTHRAAGTNWCGGWTFVRPCLWKPKCFQDSADTGQALVERMVSLSQTSQQCYGKVDSSEASFNIDSIRKDCVFQILGPISHSNCSKSVLVLHRFARPKEIHENRAAVPKWSLWIPIGRRAPDFAIPSRLPGPSNWFLSPIPTFWDQRFFNLASRTPPPPSALHLPDERLTVYQSSRSHEKLSPTVCIVFSRRCHFDPLPLTITAWGSHQRWVNLQREFLSPPQRLGRVRVLVLDATALWIAPTALRHFSLPTLTLQVEMISAQIMCFQRPRQDFILGSTTDAIHFIKQNVLVIGPMLAAMPSLTVFESKRDEEMTKLSHDGQSLTCRQLVGDIAVLGCFGTFRRNGGGSRKLSGPFYIYWKWDTVRSEMVRSIEISMLICRERGWSHKHYSRNWRPAISLKPLFRYDTWTDWPVGSRFLCCYCLETRIWIGFLIMTESSQSKFFQKKKKKKKKKKTSMDKMIANI